MSVPASAPRPSDGRRRPPRLIVDERDRTLVAAARSPAVAAGMEVVTLTSWLEAEGGPEHGDVAVVTAGRLLVDGPALVAPGPPGPAGPHRCRVVVMLGSADDPHGEAAADAADEVVLAPVRPDELALRLRLARRRPSLPATEVRRVLHELRNVLAAVGLVSAVVRIATSGGGRGPADVAGRIDRAVRAAVELVGELEPVPRLEPPLAGEEEVSGSW